MGIAGRYAQGVLGTAGTMDPARLVVTPLALHGTPLVMPRNAAGNAALHQRMLEDAHSEGQRAAKPPAADPNQPTFKAKTTPADVNK